MRSIGELEDLSQARTFSDYLTQLGIGNEIVEESKDNEEAYEIWVHSEDHVARAEELIATFRENPGADEYHGVARVARKIKKQAEKEAQEPPLYMDARTTVFYRGPTPNGALTLLLILACGGIFILSKFGNDFSALRMFFITHINFEEGSRISWMPGLPELMRGEIWRAVTPMFIHFDMIHLLFNMLWLRDLGSMVEDRKSSLFLAIFIIIVSVASNLTQYLVSHPLFGGMSGVVYGLLGYIWMKGKYDPGSRLSLHKSTVTMMIFWFFFCFTGLVGNIANGAHAGGLVMGMAWGYLTSRKFKTHLQNLKE